MLEVKVLVVCSFYSPLYKLCGEVSEGVKEAVRIEFEFAVLVDVDFLVAFRTVQVGWFGVRSPGFDKK